MTRSHSSRLLAAGIAALIAFSVSAAEPKRPVNVCIENTPGCGTTPDQHLATESSGIPGTTCISTTKYAVTSMDQRRKRHFSSNRRSSTPIPPSRASSCTIYWAVLEGPTGRQLLPGIRSDRLVLAEARVSEDAQAADGGNR